MLIVNLIGIALIALIIWWFWLYTPKEEVLGDTPLVVKVDKGVYSPARVKIASNKPSTLYFERLDPSPCAELVIFPDLQISETLTLDKKVAVTIPATPPGIYPFHCQMQMYKGELHVE